jgi:hypothetical protein
MATYTRQALAAYAFFEDARESYQYTEDALVPLVLPAIAGKGGELFSPVELARTLEPLFGPELVLPFADSMLDALVRNGYITSAIADDSSAIYVYTEKADSIPLAASVDKAERDLSEVIEVLKTYILVTRPLKPVPTDNHELTSKFVDWVTTIEAPFSDLASGKGPKDTLASGGSVDTQNNSHLHLIFSGFLSWSARERQDVFEKAARFAELGLVIDLVSEIRLPSRKTRRVDLTVVLDSGILLDLSGSAGPLAQRTALRLIELCKEHKIAVVTLSHLVDEAREICYNVLNSEDPYHRGSVNEAMRKYPSVRNIVSKLEKAPDAVIRGFGVTILPWTQVHDSRATRSFTVDDIDKFAKALPYDKGKPRMAQRDAWSLAYVARRQDGHFSSNLYDSKSALVTMSRPFASTARRFLREEKRYPNYAIIPIVELRHFATIFMLAFGSDATRKVIRAELVSTCDRIARASPGITARIAQVLKRLGKLTEEQIDAALADPNTVAEFAIVTGNDGSVVTQQHASALLDVVTNAATKDAELRNQANEARLAEAYGAKIAEAHNRIETAEAAAVDARRNAEEIKAYADQMRADAEKSRHDAALQIDIAAHIIVSGVKNSTRLLWGFLVAVAGVAGFLIFIDARKDMSGWPWFVFSALLGSIAVYALVVVFKPEAAPHRLRAWLLRMIAERRLQHVSDWRMQEVVRAEIENLASGIESGRGLDA